MYWISALCLVFLPVVSSLVQFEQCGGEGYQGPTDCDSPLQCFRRSRWYSSCQPSCPALDWDCASSSINAEVVEIDETGAKNWEQCGGEGWNGPTSCMEYPCYPRSKWFSQCRPDCPDTWLCAEIPDEDVLEEDLEDLELLNSEEVEEEETETDEFPDPSEVDLDALQQKEREQMGDPDEEADPFADAEEESTLRRRRRNAG